MERYETINWAATYFATGFAAEAALLAWTGAIRGQLGFRRAWDMAGVVGTALFLFALAVQPFVGLLLGRDWRAAEVFGIAPDPTVVATLGVLLVAKEEPCFHLLAVPVLWCAVSGTTLWTMEAGDFWVLPLAAVVTLVLAARTMLRPAAPTRAGRIP